MFKSMTAFGRCKDSVGAKDITVEIRSVNNRYFDASVRISRAYSFLEEKIKPYLQQRGISRGKVDVNISIELTQSEGVSVCLDEAYAKGYIDALYALRDTFGLEDDISTMKVAQNPQLFKIVKPEEDAAKDWEDLLSVLSRAVDGFIEGREREGDNLYRDISAKLDTIKSHVAVIEDLSDDDVKGYRARLKERIQEALEDNNISVDENRLLTECAIYADKVAIDEELVRLRSHFTAFEKIAASPEPAGRKLDFLIQEMNRETNTIGSKCCDSRIAHKVVDIKTELEKIREQIQNIE